MAEFPFRFGFVAFAETWNGRLAMPWFRQSASWHRTAHWTRHLTPKWLGLISMNGDLQRSHRQHDRPCGWSSPMWLQSFPDQLISRFDPR